MQRIMIAGATGYLGSHLVRESIKRNYPIKAIARNTNKLIQVGLAVQQIVPAEVTIPETLKGSLEGIDVLISTVGITRQKDGLTYKEVDYQGNLNLLNEAIRAGVKKMIYVSSINGRSMRSLKMIEAKERFVDALIASGMDYLIVRPNGFFSDMSDFLNMAKSGRVYLFGDGEHKLNPIHGEDLAQCILDHIDEKGKEIDAGGPDILTQNEIANLALKAHHKPVKIIHLPDWMRRVTIFLMRTLTSEKTYGPYEFFLTMMAQDHIAPRSGVHRLKSYFIKEVDNIKKE
jgi:uncharacterized protein YbjT (DUF2867 family)